MVECEQSERIETTTELQKYIGGFDKLNHPATVAIRPEAFTLDPDGIEAEILFISEMGKDQIVTMKYLGNTVRAILNLDELEQVVSTGSTNGLIGSKVKVGLKKKGVFTFDKEGRRLS